MAHSITDITIRPYQTGDEAGILESFNLVFREVCGEGYVDRSMDHWRWQFENNPWGHRTWVGVTSDGTIASHYGGVVLPVATPHGDALFSQAVDSFTHPLYRRGLKRPGLFVHTGRPWFEHCREVGDAVTYGFPVVTAERIGEKYMGYSRLAVIDYLCRDLDVPPPSGALEVVQLTELGADVDALFAIVRGEKACLTRRTARYLSWRYLEIPGSPYELHGVRRAGELCGLMVLQPRHELIPGACTIADWVVPEGDGEAVGTLIAVAAERGRALERQRLLTVFAASSAECAIFRDRGFEVVPSADYLQRVLSHRAFHAEMPTEWLRDHWWFTLGDSDLV